MVSTSRPTAERVEDAWHTARLIPTTGIGGQDEQEGRASSSLLAVMRAVPEFGRALVSKAGAPAGRITTFTEVRLPAGDDKVVRPDGAIVVERGQTRWVCLVEVKTGSALLTTEQVSSYVDVARTMGLDAVLTISSQITPSPEESPVAVEPRRLRKVALRHLSWWSILTEAIAQHRHRGISDPDQAWILGELIAYLDNEKSGAGGFEDMGDKWVTVRDAARAQTLRANDAGVRDVVERWEQFIQYLALGMRQDLGREVAPVWPRKLEPAARRVAMVKALAESGRLDGAIRVPDAVGQVGITVDMRTRLVSTSVEVPAPREGKPKTRIAWLLRQLKDAPPALRIDVEYPLARETASEMLGPALANPDRLLWGADPKREPRAFRLTWSREMGSKRGKGKGTFVGDSRDQVTAFYREVVQRIKPWAAPAPRLPGQPDTSVTTATSQPPDFSAPGGRDPGEGLDPGADEA